MGVATVRLPGRRGLLRRWLPVLLLAFAAPALGAELTLKDGRPFCEAYDCAQLLPDAEAFRLSPRAALPIIEAVKGDSVFAYLFLSTDLVNIPAYSGRPLVTLVAIDPKGFILDAKVIHHSEPILLVGIPESVLNEYAAQFFGRNIAEELPVESPQGKPLRMAGKHPGPVEVHMITGATVTALVLEETLFSSSREVGRALGLIEEEARGAVTWKAGYVPRSWEELVAEGSIGHLRVEAAEMQPGATGAEPWIELFFADLTPEVVGMNLLGEAGHAWLRDALPEGQRAIFIVGNGLSSFKGSGFVRGGIFDRFHLRQGLNKFTFKDLDYENLYGIEAAGAPRFKESGIFFLRDTRLDPTKPWEFFYLASRLTGETATSKTFKTFSGSYHLPGKYYEVAAPVRRQRESLVVRIWRDRLPEAILLVLVLAGAMGVFFARRTITRSASRLEWLHVAVLAVSVIVIGLILKAPPSVTQLYPLVRFFQEDFRFDLFLSDPLLFVFWIFIAVTLLLWGRGWFCGWICPYGALLELVHVASRRVLPKRALYEFPERAHHLLRRLRYVILAFLLLLSVFSLEWAERLAEVEPFKTTWILGVFNREWYLVLYWWALLAAAVFNFRFFCRYLCPLGAALSLGSVVRLIGIKRKEFCRSCKICTRGCDSRAIDAEGRINRYECLYCFECEQKYHDDEVCPPLIVARRKAQKAAAEGEAPVLPPQRESRPAAAPGSEKGVR
jgi:NosR/NirI family nitrous oxide reductase transcriptional regulator